MCDVSAGEAVRDEVLADIALVIWAKQVVWTAGGAAELAGRSKGITGQTL